MGQLDRERALACAVVRRVATQQLESKPVVHALDPRVDAAFRFTTDRAIDDCDRQRDCESTDRHVRRLWLQPVRCEPSHQPERRQDDQGDRDPSGGSPAWQPQSHKPDRTVRPMRGSGRISYFDAARGNRLDAAIESGDLVLLDTLLELHE